MNTNIQGKHAGLVDGTTPRGQRIFFILCWAAYFSTYIGRMNFTASISEIANATNFTKSELGLVSSGFFIGYGTFQLVWGIAGDRFSPVKMVFGGIFTSGILNLAMSAASSSEAMAALWTCNGIAQSAVWPPLLRLTVEVLSAQAAQKASIQYSATVPCGTLATYGFCGLCAAFHIWRLVFLGAGIVLTTVSVIWLVKMAPLDSARRQAAAGKSRPSFSTNILFLLVPVCLAALVNGLLRDGVQTWMPTYLHEEYGLSAAASIFLALVLPVINLSGVCLAEWANRRVFRSEIGTAMASFLCAGAFLGLNAQMRPPLLCSLILFGLCGAMMLAANTMLVTFVPLRLHKTGRVSALSGILNSATYLGSSLSGYGVGHILERSTWSEALKFLCFGTLVAAALCFAIAGKWKRLCS